MVARSIVDDDKDLPTRAADELLQETVERFRVEDLGEEIAKPRLLLQRHCAVDVSRLALPKRINVGLLTQASPGSMQRTVQPEAGLVLEHHNALASLSLFFIAGSFLRSQLA